LHDYRPLSAVYVSFSLLYSLVEYFLLLEGNCLNSGFSCP
jgi:hypothetical protein